MSNNTVKSTYIHTKCVYVCNFFYATWPLIKIVWVIWRSLLTEIVVTLPWLKWHGKKWWGSTESQWLAWAGGAVCGRKWGGPLPVRWLSKAAALRPGGSLHRLLRLRNQLCATWLTNRCLFDSRLAGRLAGRLTRANTPGRSPAAWCSRFAQCSQAPEQEGDLSRCQPRKKKTNDTGLF